MFKHGKTVMLSPSIKRSTRSRAVREKDGRTAKPQAQIGELQEGARAKKAGACRVPPTTAKAKRGTCERVHKSAAAHASTGADCATSSVLFYLSFRTWTTVFGTPFDHFFFEVWVNKIIENIVTWKLF